MSKPTSPRAGFILPMTLVVIAVIGLALWAALAVVSSIARDIRDLNDQTRLELAASQVESRVLYLMLTEPTASEGLLVNGPRISKLESMGLTPEPAANAPPPPRAGRARSIPLTFRFDDTPYAFSGAGQPQDYVVRIQDDAGLMSVGMSDEDTVMRFLRAHGVEEVKARGMAGSLADYIDQDDLTRLNGAEADDYKRAGKRGPRNGALRDPIELSAVMNWEDVMSSPTGAKILADSGTSLAIGLRNLNTAKRSALAAWYDLQDTAIDQIIEERAKQRLLGTHDITRITGVTVPVRPESLDIFPSRRVRVTVYDWSGQRSRQMWQTWVTRSEASSDRPYYLGRVTIAKVDAQAFSKSPNGEFPKFPESERLIRR